jgi:RNA polymerase sigma factor (sigma-70 family)
MEIDKDVRPDQYQQFFYTSIRNSCLNWLKREQTKNNTHSEIFEFKSNEDIQNDIIRAEFYSLLHQQVESLPTECKKVFKLLYFEGYDASEISVILGLSICTVKSQKARGLELLRKKFKTTKKQADQNNAHFLKKLKTSNMAPNKLARLYNIHHSTMLHMIKKGLLPGQPCPST